MLNESLRFERIEIIADLFCKLGFDKIVRFDLLEPEYVALKKIHGKNVEPEYLGLIALSAGAIDFQLGMGGAERFWSTLSIMADGFKDLNSLGHIKSLMKRFLNDPINARSQNIKRKRIRRIFGSSFAEWYLNSYESLRANPMLLWRRLAKTLGSSMEKKTIVFSMKAFDISHLVCYGDYVDFPWDIPIPVDFHVKRVTISTGLLEYYGSDELFRYVWSLVLRSVRERLGRKITLLRIDSIVWQIGKIMYACKYKKESSQKSIEYYLTRKIGVEKTLANKMAIELTKFIEKIEHNKVKKRWRA